MINFLICLACCALGFCIGLFFSPADVTPSQDGFVFSKEINIVELMSVVVPILVGLLVAQFFQRPSDRKLRIRETLLNRIREVDQHLINTLEAARVNELSYAKAASISKKCSSEIESFYAILQEYSLLAPGWGELRKLQAALHAIRSPLTYSPPVISRNPPTSVALSVVNGVCKYSQSRFSEIEMRISNVRKLILKLELDVNDA